MGVLPGLPRKRVERRQHARSYGKEGIISNAEVNIIKEEDGYIEVEFEASHTLLNLLQTSFT